MTVALVEIGSRAIRLLVADFNPVGGLRTVKSSVADSPLARKPTTSSGLTRADLLALATTVNQMVETAKRHQPSHTLVFGTASVRALQPEDLGELKRQVPSLEVFTQEAESRACHSAACLVASLTRQSFSRIVSGDIGNGSFELSSGLLRTPGDCDWSAATDLGSTKLAKLYESGGLRMVDAAVGDALAPLCRGRTFPESDCLVSFSGSAPTKFAWLLYKSEVPNSEGLRYDMTRIQGRMIPSSELDQYLTMLDVMRGRARSDVGRIVSPEDPSGPETEILIAGMQAIKSTLKILKQPTAMINAYGGRHGIAWLMSTRGNQWMGPTQSP